MLEMLIYTSVLNCIFFTLFWVKWVYLFICQNWQFYLMLSKAEKDKINVQQKEQVNWFCIPRHSTVYFCYCHGQHLCIQYSIWSLMLTIIDDLLLFWSIIFGLLLCTVPYINLKDKNDSLLNHCCLLCLEFGTEVTLMCANMNPEWLNLKSWKCLLAHILCWNLLLNHKGRKNEFYYFYFCATALSEGYDYV